MYLPIVNDISSYTQPTPADKQEPHVYMYTHKKIIEPWNVRARRGLGIRNAASTFILHISVGLPPLEGILGHRCLLGKQLPVLPSLTLFSVPSTHSLRLILHDLELLQERKTETRKTNREE